MEVGRYITMQRPDIVVISSPHGVADMTRFSFYLNQRGNGSAETDNCQCPPCCYDVDVPFDYGKTRELHDYLIARNANVTGTTFFGKPGDPNGAAGILRQAKFLCVINCF